MSERAIILGAIVAIERKTARTGAPFLSVTLDSEGRRRSVFIFNLALAEDVEALAVDQIVALCGRPWLPQGRDPRDAFIIGDGYLTAYGPTRRERRAGADHVAAKPPAEGVSDVDLPF
jgi:hypothetical protein